MELLFAMRALIVVINHTDSIQLGSRMSRLWRPELRMRSTADRFTRRSITGLQRAETFSEISYLWLIVRVSLCLSRWRRASSSVSFRALTL